MIGSLEAWPRRLRLLRTRETLQAGSGGLRTHARRASVSRFVFCVGAILMGGCYEHHRLSEPDTEPPIETECGAPGRVSLDPECPAPSNALDVLFVVDNSESMREEQRTLARGLGDLFSEFAAEGLDVRLGAVSSDMGTGGFPAYS